MGDLTSLKNTRGDENIFYELRNREFFVIKSVCKRYFKIDDILIILKHTSKEVYKVITKYNDIFKIKIYDLNDNNSLNQIDYANIFPKKINTPNEIGVVTTPTNIFRATRWIKGVHVDFKWNEEDVFYKIGKLIGVINHFKDSRSKKKLTFTKLDEKHIIWSNLSEIYFVGDNLKPVNDVYEAVANSLYKYVKDKEKISLILMGYKKEDKKIVRIQKHLNELYELEQTNEKE